MIDEVYKKILELGFVPSLRSMEDVLRKSRISITHAAVGHIYKELVSRGLIRETGMNPQYALPKEANHASND